jgi:TonB-like protein
MLPSTLNQRSLKRIYTIQNRQEGAPPVATLDGDSASGGEARRGVGLRGPQFALVDESRYQAFCESLAVFWETEPPVRTIGLCRRRAWPKNYLPVPGLFCSALLHFSLTFFLLQVPFTIFRRVNPGSQPQSDHAPVKVYELRMLRLSDYFPVLESGGPGGRPGKGSRPKTLPARGGTARDPGLSIISNPPIPDNARQTIVQATSPPNLKIPFEIPLPNVVLGSVAATPGPQPAQPPLIPKTKTQPSSTANPLPPPPPDLALESPPSSNPLAALPVPAPSPRPPQKVEAPSPKQISELPPSSSGGDARQLMVLGIEPAPPADSIALPPGQRYGVLSVSPEGGPPGSPGGTTGGAANSGAAGSGVGGDGSTGIGSAGYGGGRGSPEAGVIASTASAGTVKPGESGVILPSVAAALVFAVVTPPHPSHAGIVVTAGPVGGGGLRIYGVLRAGKIYTTYLPMPGKNWILQYCAHDGTPKDPAPSRSVEVRLDPPLTPPSAEEQFDFHRPPLPKNATTDMIVLKGLIREDGSVADLSVLKGLEDTADQAALIAFGRWKFRPAMRAGKPLEVEILVGIPALTFVR